MQTNWFFAEQEILQEEFFLYTQEESLEDLVCFDFYKTRIVQH
jgi:hypothetical protein